MPKISAMVHTHNEAQRLGRLLDSLRPCDEVIVVDHGSNDETEKVARQHGASFKTAVPGVTDGAYMMEAKHDWVVCLLPTEALSEGLEASLLEWKREDHDQPSFAFAIREEAGEGWRTLSAETRLINRTKVNLMEKLPPHDPEAPVLAGDLLRLRVP